MYLEPHRKTGREYRMRNLLVFMRVFVVALKPINEVCANGMEVIINLMEKEVDGVEKEINNYKSIIATLNDRLELTHMTIDHLARKNG